MINVAVLVIVLANCRAETLTAHRTSSGQRARSWQAVRIAHSPMAPIRPDSSAIGTNFAGESQPSVGWRQRRSASNPAIFSVAVWTTGW